jgi:uncharacterized protein with PIN domain
VTPGEDTDRVTTAVIERTSALVKLLFDEPESTALTDWLTLKTEIPKVSSDLSTVELLRTCQRIEESLVDDARRLLDGVDLVPIDHVSFGKLGWSWSTAITHQTEF